MRTIITRVLLGVALGLLGAAALPPTAAHAHTGTLTGTGLCAENGWTAKLVLKHDQRHKRAKVFDFDVTPNSAKAAVQDTGLKNGAEFDAQPAGSPGEQFTVALPDAVTSLTVSFTLKWKGENGGWKNDDLVSVTVTRPTGCAAAPAVEFTNTCTGVLMHLSNPGGRAALVTIRSTGSAGPPPVPPFEEAVPVPAGAVRLEVGPYAPGTGTITVAAGTTVLGVHTWTAPAEANPPCTSPSPSLTASASPSASASITASPSASATATPTASPVVPTAVPTPPAVGGGGGRGDELPVTGFPAAAAVGVGVLLTGTGLSAMWLLRRRIRFTA